MPSSTSSSKGAFRLPRLFFAKPSEIVPRDYERPIPAVPWRGMTVIVVLIVIAAAAAWGALCPLHRLFPYPERHERPLGPGAPSGDAGVRGYRG